MATGKVLQSDQGEATPAFLSHTSKLSDVQTRWFKIGED
jgi:hypothetical protein